MWAVTFGAIDAGIEPFVGVGGFGVVCWLAVHIIRRTQQIDSRNDNTSKAYMEIAFRRESESSARLDAAHATIEKLHAENSLLRNEYEAARKEWEQRDRRT